MQIITLVILVFGVGGSWATFSHDTKTNSDAVAQVKKELEEKTKGLENKIDEQGNKLDDINIQQNIQGERLRATQEDLRELKEEQEEGFKRILEEIRELDKERSQ